MDFEKAEIGIVGAVGLTKSSQKCSAQRGGSRGQSQRTFLQPEDGIRK
jgi:hypothetical protein